MSKTIAITGGNGFIGKALIDGLLNQGHEIIAFSRTTHLEKTFNIQYRLFELGKPLNIKDFEGVDILIHLAYGKPESEVMDEFDMNIISAKALVALPIPNKIFVSSFAAVAPASKSYYGKCKVAVEEIFRDHIIVRPALVIGEGGLWAKLKSQITKNRFVPLLNSGIQIIQVIQIDDLVRNITDIIKNEKNGVFHLANIEKTTYKQVIQQVSNQVNKKVIFVPIPIFLLRLLIKVIAYLPNPPINKDNLEGLLASKYVAPPFLYQGVFRNHNIL
jgi:nucleoside-diphosphate-sugar epimerase